MSLLPNHPKRVAARKRLEQTRQQRRLLRLQDPAPHRHWIKTPDGWISEPWGEAAILSTLQSGGYFDTGKTYLHDFASPTVARFAGEAQRTLSNLLEEIRNG